MIIYALDWDGCAEENIPLWLMFVRMARATGNKVYIVTMRYPSEVAGTKDGKKAIPHTFIEEVDGVICSARQAKRTATEWAGIKIDVWIDDHPMAVDKSAEEIWGWCTPEGVIVKSVAEAEEVMGRPA